MLKICSHFIFQSETLEFSNFPNAPGNRQKKKQNSFFAGTRTVNEPSQNSNICTELLPSGCGGESGKVAKGKRKFSHSSIEMRTHVSGLRHVLVFHFKKTLHGTTTVANCLPTANNNRKDSVCFSQNMHRARL